MFDLLALTLVLMQVRTEPAEFRMEVTRDELLGRRSKFFAAGWRAFR